MITLIVLPATRLDASSRAKVNPLMMCVPWNVIGPVWDARRPIVIGSSDAPKAARGNTKRDEEKRQSSVSRMSFHSVLLSLF